jgi:hypothetical protein
MADLQKSYDAALFEQSDIIKEDGRLREHDYENASMKVRQRLGNFPGGGDFFHGGTFNVNSRWLDRSMRPLTLD